MNDSEIIGIFIEEAQDLLVQWEKDCLSLEKNISNPDYSSLFRCAHNLKGAAKSVGLDGFGDFIHGVEDVITLLQNGEVQLIPQLINYLLDCQSLMVEWLEGMRSDPSFNPDSLKLQKKTDAIKAFAKDKSKTPEEFLKDFGTVAVEEGFVTTAQVEKAANIQKRRIGEIMVDEGMIPPEAVDEILDKQQKQRDKLGVKRMDEIIRVSARKIDSLIQLIGELSIHQSIISHSLRTKQLNSIACYNAITLAAKINSEIQSNAMSLRMLPLEGLFQRLERIIADLSRGQGKKVKVVLKGSDVELDKTIMEKITEPLIHIVRNSVDHGVELPEVRIEKGKNEQALVEIRAEQDASGIAIIIKDDGKGLDKDKIYQKALEKRLITANEDLSEAEILNLIFAPGFSTAEVVTDVSGRGVGMDVVRKAVSLVSGATSISGKKDQGTQIEIKLPTTLSIVDSIVIGVDGNRYIVPLFELTEIIDLDSYKLGKTSTGENMINLRGKVVPVERLGDYFPDKKTRQVGSKTIERNGRPALILDIDNYKIAFEVDEVIAQQQVVMRSLNEQLAQLNEYSGGTIMENGEVGMIIELKKLAQKYNDSVTRKEI